MDAIYGNIGDYQQNQQSQENTINKNNKSLDFKKLQDELSKKLKQPFTKPTATDITDLEEEPIYENVNETVQPQNANFIKKQNMQTILPTSTETAKYNQTQKTSEIHVTKRNNVTIPLENDDDEAVYGNFDTIVDYNKEKLSTFTAPETEKTEEDGKIDTIKTSEYNKTKTTTPDFAESLKLALQSRRNAQTNEKQEKTTNNNNGNVTANIEDEPVEYDNIITTPSDQNIGRKIDFKLNLQLVQNALSKKFVQNTNENADNNDDAIYGNLSYPQTPENARKISKTSVSSFKSDGLLTPGSNVKRFTPSPEPNNEEEAFYGNLPPTRQTSKTSTSSNDGYLTPRKFTKSPVNDKDTSFDNTRKTSKTSVNSNTSSDGYLTPITPNVRKFSKSNTPEPMHEEDAIYGNIDNVRKISKTNTPEPTNDEDALYGNLSNLQTTRKISNNSSDGYLTPIGTYGKKFQESKNNEDDETDAIYGNLDYFKIHENNKNISNISKYGQQNDFGKFFSVLSNNVLINYVVGMHDKKIPGHELIHEYIFGIPHCAKLNVASINNKIPNKTNKTMEEINQEIVDEPTNKKGSFTQLQFQKNISDTTVNINSASINNKIPNKTMEEINQNNEIIATKINVSKYKNIFEKQIHEQEKPQQKSSIGIKKIDILSSEIVKNDNFKAMLTQKLSNPFVKNVDISENSTNENEHTKILGVNPDTKTDDANMQNNKITTNIDDEILEQNNSIIIQESSNLSSNISHNLEEVNSFDKSVTELLMKNTKLNKIDEQSNKIEIEEQELSNTATNFEEFSQTIQQNDNLPHYLPMNNYKHKNSPDINLDNIPSWLINKLPKEFVETNAVNNENKRQNMREEPNFAIELNLEEELEQLDFIYDYATFNSDRQSVMSEYNLDMSPLLAIKLRELNSVRDPMPLPRDQDCQIPEIPTVPQKTLTTKGPNVPQNFILSANEFNSDTTLSTVLPTLPEKSLNSFPRQLQNETSVVPTVLATKVYQRSVSEELSSGVPSVPEKSLNLFSREPSTEISEAPTVLSSVSKELTRQNSGVPIVPQKSLNSSFRELKKQMSVPSTVSGKLTRQISEIPTVREKNNLTIQTSEIPTQNTQISDVPTLNLVSKEQSSTEVPTVPEKTLDTSSSELTSETSVLPTVLEKSLNTTKNKVKHSKSLDSCLDPPPLPPRNNLFQSEEVLPPLPPKMSLTSPSIVGISTDVSTFSPIFRTPTTTESIVAGEINVFNFDNANKIFNNDLRILTQNEQVESSNSIDVESKISDIVYGRKELKFRRTKDDDFFREAVRLSFLSLQSNESLDDDFDSDSWDEDEESEKTDITNTFSSKLDALPLKELLENQHTGNLKWSLIMNKLNINIFQIDEKFRNLQDAKFELVAAEYSFLKAVNVLNEQFVGKLCIVLSKNENNKLFAYVKEVKECSKNFLRDLEKTWQMNKFTEDFSKVICDNLEKRFDVYVRYIANQVYSEVLLGEIVSDTTRTFNEILNDLQKEPKCNGLHLHAYQLIPIRKINNFPILLENVLKCLSTSDNEYQQCKRAMEQVKQLLVRCNTESNKGKEHLRTKAVLEKLEFPKNSALQINQTGDIHMRKFIKSDKMELIEITNSLFGKKITKKMVYVFLFNDIFVVARLRTSTNKYQVLDYCFRINIELDSNPLFLQVTHNLQRNTLLYLHIKENRYLKKTELILDCPTKTDAIRWVEALDPPDTAKSHRTFDFDFIRKVIVQRNCSAVHSDEINLTIGEEFKILRETEDGWSFGQRVKDGECGWLQTENVILVDDVKRRIHDVKEKYRPNK